MQITQAMLWDMLGGYEATPLFGEERAFQFERVQLLCAGEEQLDPATLYLGTAARIKSLRGAALRKVCILCVGKRENFEKYSQRYGANLILLPETEDLFQVANHLINAFDRLNQWLNRLEKAILEQQPYQQLAELGGEVFGENPLVISDAAYNVVGCSMQGTPYNERVSEVLENRYYSKETTDAFVHLGYFARMNRFMEAAIQIDPPTYMGCPFHLFAFDAKNGTSPGFVTVYYVKAPPTPGIFDIFRVFSKKLSDYYTQRVTSDSSIPTAMETFMADLIEHTREEETYLIDRARVLKLPLDATYRLGIIKWDDYTLTLANYIIGRLRANLHFPYLKILRYRQSVLLVIQGDRPSLKVLEDVNQAFRDFSKLLKNCNGYVGFSSISNSLLKMDVAYRQASAAVKYGKLLAPEQSIHFYSRMYIYEMLDLYTAQYDLEDMFIQKLRLLQKPEEGYYSNLNLLRNYLLTERSLSATAKLLHMHRNSVIYRLGKIRDILGIDLDDSDVRLRLLISFKVLELMDGHLQPPLETGQEELLIPSME